MDYDRIEDIKNAISKESSDLREKENLLETLDETDAIDEDTWHELCETPARNSDLLLDICETIFPDAENLKLTPNSVDFELYGFSCQIPTTYITGIDVEVTQIIRCSHKAQDADKEIRKLQDVINESDAILADVYDTDDFADIAAGYLPEEELSFTTKTAKRRKMEDFINKLEHELGENEKQLEEQEAIFNDAYSELTHLTDVFLMQLIPTLEEFTERIRYHYYGDFGSVEHYELKELEEKYLA